MKTIHRILSLALAMVLVFSLAACSNTPDPTEEPTDTPTETPTDAPTEPAVNETLPSITVENPVTYFSLNMGETFEDINYIMVTDNGDGTVHVQYEGEDQKIADMDAALMHNITDALNNTGLIALNGQDNYGDGEASASMYIEFADGTEAIVGYSGTIPPEFIDGYNIMDTFFQRMMAGVPVYVPRVQVTNEVDADALAAMEEIMNGTGFEDLDSFYVSNVPKDELFASYMGLSSYEGIANAILCQHFFHHVPYGIYMATLEEGTDERAIAADFAENVYWDKFICVLPDKALVAKKGNRALCLMGSDELYTQTAAAVQAAGWTVVKELERPEE